nr:LAGLIDADG endonuclease [Ophiocordyceps lanpingensis]
MLPKVDNRSIKDKELRRALGYFCVHVHTKNSAAIFSYWFFSCLTRKKYACMDSVDSVPPAIKKNTINQLHYYLAGLIEGDGSIIVRKGKREAIAPMIVFTFGKKEIPMYVKLKQVINSGYIYTEKKGVCRYSITNPEIVTRIIRQINGKFRTPKIYALHKAIDNLNKWRNANIEKLPIDTSGLDSSAWLAGFIDTDGHFSIKLTGNYMSDDLESRGKVKCVFSLNQSEINRITDQSNVPFMTELAKFFKVNLNYKVANSMHFKKPCCITFGSAAKKTIVFFAQSDRKHYVITTYLTKFPLMSSKYLNYLSFFKGLDYLGKRLTKEEILEIRTIKNSMNNSHTDYNWDHLHRFYS